MGAVVSDATPTSSLGVIASVVMDDHAHGPRTVSEGEKQAYRDACPGWLDDIPIVSVWTLHVALYALQNPTPEIIHRALRMIVESGDAGEDWDEDMLPLPVGPPNGWDI